MECPACGADNWVVEMGCAECGYPISIPAIEELEEVNDTPAFDALDVFEFDFGGES